MTKNPYIEPENYHQGYQDSIDKNSKENPDALEFEKLCYALFRKDSNGIRLMEIIYEKFINPALVHIGSDNYAQNVTYMEGFKQAFRQLKEAVDHHEQRIKSEK